MTGKSPDTDMNETQADAADFTETEVDALEDVSAAFSNEGDEKIEYFESPLAVLAAENDELKEQNLRLAADMENLRRRTARDVQDAKSYSIANFAREMLGVSDNLRRALDAVPAEAKSGEDANLKLLVEGVEMTERAMLGALEKHGVTRLSPKGEKFNANFHQAMFEVNNPEVIHNSVVEVVQDGYVIGDRVLRPAMVGVAKGGPRQSVADAQAASSTEPDDQTS